MKKVILELSGEDNVVDSLTHDLLSDAVAIGRDYDVSINDITANRKALWSAWNDCALSDWDREHIVHAK